MFPFPFIGARKGEIDPTVAIGALLFTDSHSGVYPCNNVSYDYVNSSYTIPSNWKKKSWRYTYSITSTAAYGCVGFTVYLNVNGVNVHYAAMANTQDSYFRYNSGTLTYTFDLDLKAGDVVEAIFYVSGRNVGGVTPTTDTYHEMKRLT